MHNILHGNSYRKRMRLKTSHHRSLESNCCEYDLVKNCEIKKIATTFSANIFAQNSSTNVRLSFG